jgi:hypothetical protein
MMLCSQGCLRPKWVATTESVDNGWRKKVVNIVLKNTGTLNTTGYLVTIDDALHDVRISAVGILIVITLQFIIFVLNSGWCGLTSTHFKDQILKSRPIREQTRIFKNVLHKEHRNDSLAPDWLVDSEVKPRKSVTRFVISYSQVLRHLGRQQRKFPTLLKYTFKVFWLWKTK